MIQERTAEEIGHIERHKYFLSEKAGYDVGWDAAERDWDENVRDQWHGKAEHAAAAAVPDAPESLEDAEAPGETATAAERVVESPATPQGIGARIRTFLAKVFSAS